MWIIIDVFVILINVIFILLCMTNLVEQKTKINIKNIFVLWVMALLILVTKIFLSDVILLKPFFSILIIAFMYNRLFYKKYINSIGISFILVLTFFIFEVFYSILLLILKIDFSSMINNPGGEAISNVIIGLMCYFFIKNYKVRKLLNGFLHSLNRNPHKILIFSITILIGIFTYKNAYYNINVGYIVNMFLIIIFLVFLFLYFTEVKNKEKLSSEQEMLYNCILKYEKELTNKNKIIHDFKNQLFAIRGFVFGDNNKLEEYLSTLISDLKTLDDFKIKEINKIPLGGLKGLFYCKLMDLDNTNIKLNIYIDKKISYLEKLNIRTYKNIVKILGIYIDNAIEAAKDSKGKELEIEFYKQGNKLIFTITNSYVGKIFKEKLGTIGYSNKGKGRGYGLSYVKDILDKEDNLEEIRKITDNKYSVGLVINI